VPADERTAGIDRLHRRAGRLVAQRVERLVGRAPARVGEAASGNGTEWSPAFGVLWWVVRVPMIAEMFRSSLSPLPSRHERITIGLLLKRASPRAIACRATATTPSCRSGSGLR
jgi:hypothetical protein